MSFTYRLRLGGYSLDTQIRLQSPFKARGTKVATDATVTLSEKNSDGKILQDSPPSPTKFKREDVVREGPVCVKECGIHPRNWFFTIKWLVLYEDEIALHVSQTKPPRSSILLADVIKLERTARLPYGLNLQTKNGRRFLLSFEKDSDLYDWQDEISRRSMGVGLPYNFVHNTHASFDVTTGTLTV
ncbi:hypothetical protein C8R45DRAFT_85609 [Mycena sanguinolenta]|nr:hypothetical protein C8R45DRAFT_85609 [Mycena sanguinolenta]